MHLKDIVKLLKSVSYNLDYLHIIYAFERHR